MLKQDAIIEICHAPTLLDSLHLYKKYKNLVQGCKFIFPTQNGNIPGFAVNHNFSATGAIRSLFNTDKFIVIDEKTVTEMDNCGKSTFLIDYTVSLDSQAVSYIECYINGNMSRVPLDFPEAFDYICTNDANYDAHPYFFENLTRICSGLKSEKIFSKVKAYEIFRTIDIGHFTKSKEIRSLVSDEELERSTHNLIDFLVHANKTNQYAQLHRIFKYLHCIILKMALIHFNYKRKSPEKKIMALLEFMDQELSAFFKRESVVAYRFFELGYNFEFFKKIQHPTNRLATLYGMAWDFFHIRYLEQAITQCPRFEARYLFPALLTFDKSFIEIIDLCPVRAVVYADDKTGPQVFYYDDLEEKFLQRMQSTDELNTRFFSPAAVTARSQRRQIKTNEELDTLIGKLENEVMQY